MNAEEGFVNSLDDVTAVKVHVALENRFNEKMKAKYGNCQPAQAVSVSTLACTVGYAIPMTITEEVQQQTARKEDAMSDLDTARRHMDTRLYGVKRVKRDALKTQFGLADLPRPTTWTDMATRLKAGQFTLPTDLDDGCENRYISLDCLEWRDPSVKKDRPGFEAAEKLLDASATKVKDAIWVKTNPEDALALLEAFESSTVN